MGKTLDDLFDDPKTAENMIALLADTAAKAVAKDIKVSEEQWGQMEPSQQKAAIAQAVAWATRRAGHRTKCPACGSPALIHGSNQGVVTTDIREDDIVQRQTMLPSSFECIACGLKISGLSKLSACGLGNAFTSTSTMSPADFFGLHTEQELEEARQGAEAAVEEDFNEY
jgi:transcription elongation factor Elf1